MPACVFPPSLLWLPVLSPVPALSPPPLPTTAELLTRLVYQPDGLTWAQAEPALARLCMGELELACLVWVSDGLRDPDTEAIGALCAEGDPDACELGAWLAARGATRP